MEKTMIRSAMILFSLVSWWTYASAQITPQKEPEVNIVIDGSAARYVLENPARALENRDSIWNTFTPSTSFLFKINGNERT